MSTTERGPAPRYDVRISSTASKELAALPREAQRRIAPRLRALATTPRGYSVLGVAIIWERRPGTVDAAPLAYYSTDGHWAIFPGDNHGWELCWANEDEGFSLVDWYRRVASAQRSAQRSADHDAALVAARAS